MELGEKLRLARLEAGLSQRQLCTGGITRNMLSQIENGSAKPSMKTLRFLAERLGKSVSYFLEETAVVSPNQEVMAAARQQYDSGEFALCADTLSHYNGPDAIFDREKALLWNLCHLELAEEALTLGREPYALELLHKIEPAASYCAREVTRRQLLLQGRIRGEQVCERLPSIDEELLLRAGEALEAKQHLRAGQLLDAAQQQSEPHWNLLRGRVFLESGCYMEAIPCLQTAEPAFPETAALLEICFRELGDFKQAYAYACKQRSK